MGIRRRALAAASCLTVAALTLIGASPAALAVPPAPVAAAGAQVTAVPRPDHVVVLVLENHASSSILGNPDAPYINALAASGANLTQSFGVTHPSQPNYIALFSGSLNGVTDNGCPYTLAADNLGSQLAMAGLGFAGYSENLPSVGYTGCTSGPYARKHNPWVSFSNVPASANRPLTSFPTDYSTLPAVSFVVPNLNNDMHDGSIGQGDAWIRDHLDGYVQWAKQHNSVFVLTFDEDDNTANNQIATLVLGQRVQPGAYAERVDHYSVLRTIQDAFGLPPLGEAAAALPIVDIWTAGSDAPVAAFSARCTDLSCSADGSASTAPGGSIARWRWDWGDGAVTTDARASQHAYAAAGTFPVTLTVTDGQGATASVSHDVTVAVAPPASVVLAADGFNRSVSGGLGSADVGGVWSLGGAASSFSVSSGAASLVLQKPGDTRSASLAGVSSSDTDLRVGVAASPLPNNNGLYVTVVGRRVATNAEYSGRARVRGDGSVLVSITALLGSSTVTTLRPEVVASGVNVAAGAVLSTRLQVTGTSPTTVSWKVWSGATEPAGWQQTVTDGVAVVQGKGSVGVTAYLSGSSTVAPVTTRLSNLSARTTTTAPPPNQPPTAAFTSSAANLTASFDAGASSDPDGTVASYAWDFGDGSAAGSGSKPAHTYAAAGTFPVRLTVTDDKGAPASVSHDVTVTAPPVNQPPTAAFTSSAADLAVSFDATGSADPDGTVAAYGWDFGDGSAAGSGSKPAHTYAAAGTFPVKLTVTDDQGATASVSHDVTVTAPASSPVLASDAFARSVSAGWGAAEVGGGWTVTGTASSYAVSSGAGSLVMQKPGDTRAVALPGVSSSDTDLRLGVAVNPLPNNNGVYVTVVGRRVATNAEYQGRARVRGDGSVLVSVGVLPGSSTVTTLRSDVVASGVNVAAGAVLNTRLQVTGTSPTTVRWKVWTGSTEPTGWQQTVTDSTPVVQGKGSIGLSTYLSSGSTVAPVTARVSNLSARSTAG